MVDKTVLAARVAAVRDAVARIRAVLPGHADASAGDRKAFCDLLARRAGGQA